MQSFFTTTTTTTNFQSDDPLDANMDTEQQPADLDPYFPFLSCSTILLNMVWQLDMIVTYYYICSDKRTPSVLSAPWILLYSEWPIF